METHLIEHQYNELETRSEHITNSLFSKENFSHYMAVADFLSKSTMVPKSMIGKPADILIALDMGLQLGIPLMQSLQDIAVINGRPVMYGDGLLAVVQGHKDYEWIKESCTADSATCIIKRKNHEPHTTVFTIEEAKKAKLWGKPGPWSDYPSRMLAMRARGFCIRDTFSDALRGVKTAEEVGDYQSEIKQSKAAPSDVLKDLLAKKQSTPEPVKTIVLSDTEQHDEIERLMLLKEFSIHRIDAACKYYGVKELIELDHEQANDFIAKLNAEPNH